MTFDSNFHIEFSPADDPVKTLDRAEAAAREVGIHQALAVDLPSQNRHLSAKQYVTSFDQQSFFHPVPTLRSVEKLQIHKSLKELKELGCTWVKIHPRQLGISICSTTMQEILQAVHHLGFGLLLCSYPYTQSHAGKANQHLPSCLDFLTPPMGWPPTILMHGGATQFLDVCEWARPHKNIYVDLSFTITQFQTSSVWLDMQSALGRFEQRLVLGSDHPFEELGHWHEAKTRLLAPFPAETRRLVETDTLQRVMSATEEAHV